MAVFLVLAIPFWFLPGARTVIAPLKLFVIGWHELCHMMAVRTSLAPTRHNVTDFLNKFRLYFPEARLQGMADLEYENCWIN